MSTFMIHQYVDFLLQRSITRPFRMLVNITNFNTRVTTLPSIYPLDLGQVKSSLWVPCGLPLCHLWVVYGSSAGVRAVAA